MELAKRNAFGIKLAAASIGLGIVGDLILSNEAWGASLPLFAAFLIAQVMLLTRISERKPSRTAFGLMAAAFAFSLCFLWRDAPELKLLNGLAVFALVGLAAIHATGKRLGTAPIAAFAFQALALWAVFIADFCLLFFKDVKWAEAVKQRGLAGTGAVARGLLIATPLVVIFGALLISADAAFQSFLQQFTNFDSGAIATHVVIGVACAVLTGGLLRHLFLAEEAPPKVTPFVPFVLPSHFHSPYRSPEPFRLGSTELGIVLGSLNLLFGMFVLIEAPYLFGGAQHVLSTAHLSYADYARRGFFELVTVVALAIPVLLGSHALIKKESPASEVIWRAMSILMVSLLLVVMHSAEDRMRIYVDLYSLTKLRVYVFASLGWMALMLLWFLATTIRGHSQRFAFGAFVSLLGTIFLLNALNPDALIVRYNVALAGPGKPIDGSYLVELSADATPELIGNSAKLDDPTRASLASNWLREEKESRGHWRSWTLSRLAANHSIAGSRETLANEALRVVASASPEYPD